VDGSVKDVVSN